MTAHHPGPWAISNPVQRDALTIQCEGATLATIDLSDATGDDLARLLASAKLMRAAPRLFEALELADLLLSGANMNPQVVERKAREAIAEARGLA